MNMMVERTDAELVAASVDGGVDAFSTLVERYQLLVCGVCFSATGNWATSEDLAQETFLVAWRRVQTLDDPRRLRAWLCGIARNVSSKAVRRRRPEVSIEAAGPLSSTDSPLDDAIARQHEQLVWEALERIPEQYREPLVLYYQQGQSTTEVADALGLSASAVHQRLSRGRRYLEDGVQDVVEQTLRRNRPKKGLVLSTVAMIHAGQATSAEAATLAPVTTGVWTMAWMKFGTVIAVGALIAFGLYTVTSDEAVAPADDEAAPATVVRTKNGEPAPADVSTVRPAPLRPTKPSVALPAAPKPTPDEVVPDSRPNVQRSFDLRGVEKNWASGKIGKLLMPCLEVIDVDYDDLSFALDVQGGEVRGVRVTGGDAIGVATDPVELCIADRLKAFGLEPITGEAAELEITTKRHRALPAWNRELFEQSDYGDLPSRGAANAPITMVVFTGMRCVYCGDLLGTVDQLLEEYPTVLRVLVKPVAFREENEMLAEAVFAAQAQGRFWPLHDAMFANQDHLDAASIRAFAAASGLDLARFDADMLHRTFKEQVQADARDAKLMGVVGLPSVVLGGERIMGAQPIAVFRERIEALTR